MKKKLLPILLCTMLAVQPVTTVFAEEGLNFGDTVDVSRDEGNYKVSIDDVVATDNFNSYTEGTGTKIVCVQCTIENIDYNNYENLLPAYEVGKDCISLLDEDGISTEFFGINATSDSVYEYYAEIKPGEKKRASLPYFVPEDDSSLTIQIDSKYSLPVTLETGNEESNDEQSDGDIQSLHKENQELKDKVESLEAENKDLKEQNEKLKKENEELKANQATPAPEATPTPEATQPVTEYKDATTIRITQQALNEAGYNCGNPDGVAGGKTSQAITSYQTAKGITVNGLVTDELLQSLGIVEKVQEAVKAEGAKNEYSADYSYDQLARNPDTYIGQKVKITGKVLQAETGDDICYARVAMNSNYDTVVFVTYDKDLLGYRLLEDDVITVYGTACSTYSYKAVSGATITIPWLHADIIEM